MIILITLWVLYSISEGYEDSQYTMVMHGPTVYPRLVTGLMVVWAWLQWPLTWHHAALGFWLASIFWFVFELSRNLFTGHYFYYIGGTARTDRALKQYEFPVFFLRAWLVCLGYCMYYYREILNSY